MDALILTPNKYTYEHTQSHTIWKEWHCEWVCSSVCEKDIFDGHWPMGTLTFSYWIWFHENGQKWKQCINLSQDTFRYKYTYWPFEINCQRDIEPDSILFVWIISNDNLAIYSYGFLELFISINLNWKWKIGISNWIITALWFLLKSLCNGATRFSHRNRFSYHHLTRIEGNIDMVQQAKKDAQTLGQKISFIDLLCELFVMIQMGFPWQTSIINRFR